QTKQTKQAHHSATHDPSTSDSRDHPQPTHASTVDTRHATRHDDAESSVEGEQQTAKNGETEAGRVGSCQVCVCVCVWYYFRTSFTLHRWFVLLALFVVLERSGAKPKQAAGSDGCLECVECV